MKKKNEKKSNEDLNFSPDMVKTSKNDIAAVIEIFKFGKGIYSRLFFFY